MYFYDYPIIGAEAALPLYLISVGVNEWQYHVVNKEGEQYAKILYCTKGSGTLVIGGTKRTIEPYTAIFFPAGYPHEYYTNGDCWDTHWVIPAGHACDALLSQFGFTELKVFKLDDIKYLEHCFRKMHEAIIGDRVFGNFRASGYLYDFLIELYRIFSSSTSTAPTNPVVTRALDYIETHYRAHITLDELCEVAGVTKQHLCRLFRSTLSCRPTEYIAKRRIQAAKEILSNTDKPTEAIAEELGFCDSSYFCKIFRRYEGITPSQFRGS